VLVNTDPYRPPVAYTTFDDMPFIVKGTQELPSSVMDPNESGWCPKARAEGAPQYKPTCKDLLSCGKTSPNALSSDGSDELLSLGPIGGTCMYAQRTCTVSAGSWKFVIKNLRAPDELYAWLWVYARE
jgi:hypothetical protein